MDSSGSAFPSQATLAKAACVAEFTMQKKLNQASELAWLGIRTRGHTGRGWKRYEYVACVPDHIQIPEKHEQLAEKFSDEMGDVETKVVPTVDGDDGTLRRATSPSSRSMVPILSNGGPHPDTNIVPIQDGTKSSSESSQAKLSSEGVLAHTAPVFSRTNKGEIRTAHENQLTQLKPINDETLWHKIQKFEQVGDCSVSSVIKQLAGNYKDITHDRISRVLRANGRHLGTQSKEIL